MRKEFIESGKIVGTHGIRGMVRIQPWCDSCEFLCNFKKLYINALGTECINITSAKPHGNVVIAAIKGIDTIEKAEALRGKVVYINRKDANLEDDRYFIQDIIGCKVFDADTNKLLGEISDVSATGANDVWHIKNGDKEYLIPCIDEVVISVDIDSDKVVIRPLKGIFDDEN